MIKTTNEYGLPFNGGLRSFYIVSLLIAILAVAASLIGLLNPQNAYPEEVFVQSFVPNDVVTLFVGLPVLLISMWLTSRGKLTGLLCWPGALFYVLYNYLSYVFALPLSWAFLIDLTLVLLSAYALIAMVAALDTDQIRRGLEGNVGERFSGSLLMAFGLLILGRVGMMFFGVLTGGEPISETEIAVSMADFLIAPAYFIGGLLLWRRQALGYAAGLGLLFQASMLFIALVALILIQPILTNAPFAWVDGLIVLVMGLICFVPFWRYWSGSSGA